jgi:hypothetical protein
MDWSGRRGILGMRRCINFLAPLFYTPAELLLPRHLKQIPRCARDDIRVFVGLYIRASKAACLAGSIARRWRELLGGSAQMIILNLGHMVARGSWGLRQM